MKIKFTDTHQIGSARKTAQGYLVATARIARTGVQEYLASELGMVGDGVIRINRSPEQVFHKDSIQSRMNRTCRRSHNKRTMNNGYHAS